MDFADSKGSARSVTRRAAFADGSRVGQGMGGRGQGGMTGGAGGGLRSHGCDGTARTGDLGVSCRQRQLLGVVDVTHGAVVAFAGETDFVEADGGSAEAEDRIGLREFLAGMDLMNHGAEVDGLGRSLGGRPAGSVSTGRVVTEDALFDGIAIVAVQR